MASLWVGLVLGKQDILCLYMLPFCGSRENMLSVAYTISWIFPPFSWSLQVVGESGLFTPDDIAYVQEAGVKAVSPTN